MSGVADSEDRAKDVLAAEEFAVPAADPALRPERLDLPTDLVGGEPRDVLVAEEFAMPAPDEARVPPQISESRRPPEGPVAVSIALALIGLWLGWRWRRAVRTSRRGASGAAGR